MTVNAYSQSRIPISPDNRVIYEVHVRNFSSDGSIKAVEDQLDRLKDLGVDILWLMPIYPIGKKNREGKLGSPYSIKDYKSVNPELGNLDDFKSLVAKAHELGIVVWLDWVANHTAWDHPWITDFPDFYAERDGVKPYSPENWLDVAQLDFSNPEMRKAMIDAMKFWVSETDIDGFRCDAATFVPLDFWIEARKEVDKLKPIEWFEEGDGVEYLQAFDGDYAWDFHSKLKQFGKTKNVQQLQNDCQELYYSDNYKDNYRMIYLTNHDISAHDGTESQLFGDNQLPLTVLYFTLYDMPLIYNGQEIGYNKSIGLFNADTISWSNPNEITTLMKSLTQMKRSLKALAGGKSRGQLEFQQTSNEDVLMYKRIKDDDEILVAINFSNDPISVEAPTSVSGKMKNCIDGEIVDFAELKQLSIPAKGYLVYTNDLNYIK